MTSPTSISYGRALPRGRGDVERIISWKNLTDLDKRKHEWNERECRWVRREYERFG